MGSSKSAKPGHVRTPSHALGYVALAFAIASWFLWPIIMGATAALLGFIAYRQGSRTLGGWAIALGMIALAAFLVLIPIYYRVM